MLIYYNMLNALSILLINSRGLYDSDGNTIGKQLAL